MPKRNLKQSGDWGNIVRRIKSRRKGEVDWRTIIRRIKANKCTPIVSYQVTNENAFANKALADAWANELRYPLPDTHDLSRIAQYATTTHRDALSAKEDYLEFLKYGMLARARSEASDDEHHFLDTLEDELYDLSFSDVTMRLGYPNYEDELDNPLRILAELPLPIYLTTNYTTFLEESLKDAGKEPVTEICYWHDDLENEIESIFSREPDYHPTVERPLVFHLHGLDSHPSSIVLTEDDYLDFLVKISRDPDVVPRRIIQAIADSSLLLLGYQLGGWDFRTIFRGLITSRYANRRLLSISVQFELEEDEYGHNLRAVHEYLQKYFNKANFDIFWGDTQSFMQELWKHWEG